MSKFNIDEILMKPPSKESANLAMEWYQDLQLRLMRGDLMIGILSMEEVEKAENALQFAYKGGCTEALFELVNYYKKDYKYNKVEEILKEAIKAGVKDAVIKLIEFRWFELRDGLPEEEEAETCKMLIEYMKENENAHNVIYLYGLFLCAGFGTKRDPVAAFKLQEKAAAMGNSNALFELYIHYSTGIGTEIDNEKAFEANLKAAEAGHYRACYNMGSFYATGKYVKKDMLKAVEWYSMAVDAGSGQASATLAVMYAQGEDVEKDMNKAEELFREAEYLGFDTERYREMAGMESD